MPNEENMLDPDASQILLTMIERMPRQLLIYGIGTVVITATQVEMAVGHLYAALLNSELAEVVAHGQGFQTALVACRAVIDRLPASPELAPVEPLLATANALYQRRNEVVHGFWIGNLNVGARHTVRFKRWGKREVQSWDGEALLELARELAETATAIGRVATEIENGRHGAPEITADSDLGSQGGE